MTQPAAPIPLDRSRATRAPTGRRTARGYVEIGYTLAPPARCKGIGTTAVAALAGCWQQCQAPAR